MAPTVHAQATEKDAFVGDLQTVVKEKKYDPVAANCYRYIKETYPNLPLTKDIVDNTPLAVGVVAFFKYGSLNHYAIVTKLDDTGFWIRDSNFGGPGYRTHLILYSDVHLRGFYLPGAKVD